MGDLAMFWIGLAIGLFVGANVGVLIIAVMSMSKPLPAKPDNVTSIDERRRANAG
jgi:uncharacterized membrane-anchored protein YhcB (DUF1043 family)